MQKNKQIVLSGIQPTGELHIGNYLGSLKNFVELQDKYTCYFFIATYHSLTEDHDPKIKKQQVLDVVIDYLAAGLDPKKCIIFNQTDVPECTELAWIFNTLTPVSEIERMTQFKDKAGRQLKNINVGLLDYPVLQAADILLYHANTVPVGQDQVQHVELTRKCARWFNNKYGKYFEEPKPLLTKVPKVMSLVAPDKKMSKSSGPSHYIGINDDPKTIEQKVKKAVTGTGTEKQIPAGAQNLLLILEELGFKDKADHFKKQIASQDIKYSELKTTLTEAIADYFAAYRIRRKKLEKDLPYIEKVLKDGATQAQKVAQKTMEEVKEHIGL